jgi:hypothetical protein
MHAALSMLESAPPVSPEEGTPDTPLSSADLAVHGNAANGHYRFWACARGPGGRSQATAVWGLWLDRAVVFAADTETVAAGDPRVFPASVVQLEEDGQVRLIDGSAERVDDSATLARFASQCEAKYGFEPDPSDPDTPVYVVRPPSGD